MLNNLCFPVFYIYDDNGSIYLVSNRMVLSYNRQTTQYNRFSLLNPRAFFLLYFLH